MNTSTPSYAAAYYVPKIVSSLRALGGKAKAKSVRDMIVDEMLAAGLTLDESEVSNGEPKYQNQIYWARMHLVNAGMLEPVGVSGRGVWQLTTAGHEMALDEKTAAQICGRDISANEAMAAEPLPIQDDLPGIASEQSELQALLLQLSPEGFEHLCAAIMVANDAENPTVTGKSNDKGVDGTAVFAVDAMNLITFRVAWQCKRYATDNKVSPSDIRDFRGALDQGIQHGVFFTTSTFTLEAQNEARAPGKIPINLVNIHRLIALLINKNIGVIQDGDSKVSIDNAYFAKFKRGPASAPLFKQKEPTATGMSSLN